METVDIVQCKHVDELLDRIDREEVACHVEVRSAITETRLILDNHGREIDIEIAYFGNRLAQGLDSIEVTCRSSAVDDHEILGDGQLICLGVLVVQSGREHYGVLLSGLVGNLKSLSCHFLEICGKEFSVLLQFFISCRIHDCRRSVEAERLT